MSNKKPLVSIGLIVFNGQNYIRDALDALILQDYENFELIISDNASTDDTKAICKEYARTDKRIKYSRNSSNLGGANICKVLEMAHGEFFMWAAHDDKWDKSYISKCVSKLHDYPQAVMCCSEITFINSKGIPLVHGGYGTYVNIGSRPGMDIHERVHELINRVGWFAFYGVWRTDAIRKIDLYSDNIQGYGGDVILLLYMMLIGDFVKVEEHLFYYRVADKEKTTEDYLLQINGTLPATAFKAYTYLATELYKIILQSGLNQQNKSIIRTEFLNTLSQQNDDWLGRIARENFPQGLHDVSIGKKQIIESYVLKQAELEYMDSLAERKKVLAFFPHNLMPTKNGAQKRCLDLLLSLQAAGHDVILVSSTLFTDDPWQKESIDKLKNEYDITVLLHNESPIDREYLQSYNSQVDWRYFTPPSLVEFFMVAYDTLQPEIVYINYAMWGGLVKDKKYDTSVLIMEMHDLITSNQKMQNYARAICNNPDSMGSILLDNIDEEFYKQIDTTPSPSEFKVYDRFDIVTAIAPSEAELVAANTNRPEVVTLPHVFKANYCENTYSLSPIFVIGSNLFNSQGYAYFVNKILPLILVKQSDFELRIIGGGCKQLHQVPRGIKLLGFVHDLASIYADASFAICPLIGGTGQQIKIVEAMSYGVPVIALANVSFNSPIIHEENGLVANNAEEFARYMVKLLNDKEQCRKLGKAARQTIFEAHFKNKNYAALNASIKRKLNTDLHTLYGHDEDLTQIDQESGIYKETSQLLNNKKRVKIAGEYESEKDLTQIDQVSSFAIKIDKVISEYKPTKIIETGTYLGTGTTFLIAKALKKYGFNNTKFFSIEVNPKHYAIAQQNIKNQNIQEYVTGLLGLSVPRNMLPDINQIEENCVSNIEFDNIFVDHQENERAKLYYNETNYSDGEEDLLGKCLASFNNAPDFVLLDSGGHMGNVEFNYLINKLKKSCIIALDDIYHVKHRKSFEQIKTDSRFKLLAHSDEKFGFCIAKFTYDSKIEVETLISKAEGKEIISCLICGSDKSSIVHSPDIVRCDKCGFVFLKERPTQKWMENYYKNIYAANVADADVTVAVPKDFNLLDTKEEYIAAQRKGLFEEAVAYYGKDITGKTLVDIGCGWGALLYNARKNGMNVIGFEFTNHNVDYAQNVLKLDVRQEQFADSNLPENSIDIVTMVHVLEHVSDPLKLVKKINYVLKPGGVFYCVVPNFYSLCSAFLGENWAWLERNWHYSYFTKESISNLFIKSGLSIENFYTTVGDYGSEVPLEILKSKYPQKSSKELSIMLEELNKQNFGEEIRIIGIKSESNITRNEKQDTKHILWIRTDAIGDNVLASSMLKPLKEFYKNYKITVVCQNFVRELYQDSPFVNNIISFNRRKFIEDEEYKKEIVIKLCSINAEYAFNSIFSRDKIADFFTLCTKAKFKIAHQGDLSNILEKDREENNKSFSKLIPTNPTSLTELERHNDFLKGIGIESNNLSPKIWLNKEDLKYADKVFFENNLEIKKTIALFAGAQYEVRIYNNYGKALNKYCKANGFNVVILGSSKDHQVNNTNIKDLSVKTVDLTGKTTVRQSAAIIKKCTAAIGAETGLAHIACAVGTKNLILLGGGHFGRFMPYSNLTSIVSLPLECFGCNWQCKYGTTTCIKDIDYQVISSALENMMTQTQDKTIVYLQSEYKHDFLSGLPKISGIENLLKCDFEIKNIKLETIGGTSKFTNEISEFKDEKYFNTLNKLNQLFNLNSTDFNKYSNFEEQLLTEKNNVEALFKNDSNNYEGNPFYNYLKGLYNQNKKNYDSSYDYYLMSYRASKNLRVLYKLAQVADKNFLIPQVYFLFKELLLKGVMPSEALNKSNSWAELLSVKNVLSLSDIDNTLDIPSVHLNKLEMKEDRPTISFIIPSKNRGEGLSSFLSSLDNACFGLSYEVLLYCGDELNE